MNRSSTPVNDEIRGFELADHWLLRVHRLLRVDRAAALSLICRRYDRIATGQRLANSGRMIRPHRDQFLDSCHLAADEDDVEKFKLGPVCGCRLQVAGVQAQSCPE